MTDLDIPADDKEFIIEKRIEGWAPEMIGHELRKQREFGGLRDETIESFLNKESTKAEIELEKKIQEKKAEVSREDLIRELSDQVDYISQRRKELEGENDEISSEQTKNLLKAVKDLAEMIDVLESKDGGGADNVVNINKLEQNFDLTQTVQYLPAEDKRDIVEQLEDDDSIEDFIIKRKNDEEKKVEA